MNWLASSVQKRRMKPTILKLSLLYVLFMIRTIPGTVSYFSDSKVLSSNIISTGCWTSLVAPQIPVNPFTGVGMFHTFSFTPISLNCGDTNITYSAQFSTSPNFTPGHNTDTITDITIDSVDHTFDHPGTYYWHVKSCNSSDCSNYSSPVEIRIIKKEDIITRITTDDSTITYQKLDIEYDVSPPAASGIQVRLCYSYNTSNFDCDNNNYTSSSGKFNFDFPDGDGLYAFETRAIESGEFIEEKNLTNDIDADNYLVILRDTVAPNSNLFVGTSKIFSGQNLINQNSVTLNKEGEFSQILSLPQKIVSQLSFWFNMTASDPAYMDRFDVKIVNPDDNSLLDTILSTGSQEGSDPLVWNGYSGWQQIIHPLYDFANKNIKIIFSLINQDDEFSSADAVVEVSDIKISTIDLRLGETNPVDINVHDITSGIDIASTTPPSVIQVGENTLTYNSEDIAGNHETSESIQIKVLPSVVLNKINFYTDTNSIDLYNNTDSDINLAGWYIAYTGSTIPLTDITITANSIYSVDTPDLNNNTDTVKLYSLSSVDPIDSTTYQSSNTEAQYWARTPDGIGTWALITSSLTSTLSYRPESYRLLMTVANITTSPVTYSIGYSGNNLPQQITGIISPDTIVEGKADREFFLGTCSQVVCTPDQDIDTKHFILTINGTTNNYSF